MIDADELMLKLRRMPIFENRDFDKSMFYVEKSIIDSMPTVKAYTAHEVAVIIADLFGDACACNFNGIDEWLPEHCELLDACPNVVGVACWEQYLKFREENR